MKKPDAIFFDWDGTLIDGFDVIFTSYNAALVHFGMPPMTQEQARENVRLSTREVFPKIFGESADEAQKIYYKNVIENHLQHIRALPQSEELLKLLQNKKIPAAVVSNKTHAILVKEIAHMGWDDSFKTCIGAGVAARDKPAPDPLIQAATNINLTAGINELWYVGDTETDMQAAHAARFKPVFIQHGLGQIGQLDQWPPALIVSDNAALIALLRDLQ